MSAHNKSTSDDNILRAFYEFCGFSQPTIEAAIKKRHERPTNFIGREKAGAACKVAYARKRTAGGK